MRNRKWIMLFFFVAACFLICQAGQAYAKDSIRLGFSMALTGLHSSAAQGVIEAYTVWQDIVNKKGGLYVKEAGKKLPVEFVFYDDQSEPGTAVRIYEKLLTNDKVDLILPPHNSSIHFAVAPLSSKYKVPLVCGTAASMKLKDIKNEWLWYVTSAMPYRQQKALVELLADLKVKTVAIAYLQDMFPRENLQFLEQYLKEAGIKIVYAKDYPQGEKDLKTLLLQAKAKNPEAALFMSYAGDTFTIVTQAQEIALDPKFMFALVGPAARAFQPKFGPAVEGVSGIGNWSPKMKNFGNKEFVDAYLARYKKLPDALNSIEAYKACQVMEQAIEKTESLDRQKVRDYIAHNEFPCVDGTIKFTGSENTAVVSGILQWQNGQMEVVWPKSIATAKPIYPKPAWPK